MPSLRVLFVRLGCINTCYRKNAEVCSRFKVQTSKRSGQHQCPQECDHFFSDRILPVMYESSLVDSYTLNVCSFDCAWRFRRERGRGRERDECHESRSRAGSLHSLVLKSTAPCYGAELYSTATGKIGTGSNHARAPMQTTDSITSRDPESVDADSGSNY